MTQSTLRRGDAHGYQGPAEIRLFFYAVRPSRNVGCLYPVFTKGETVPAIGGRLRGRSFSGSGGNPLGLGSVCGSSKCILYTGLKPRSCRVHEQRKQRKGGPGIEQAVLFLPFIEDKQKSAPGFSGSGGTQRKIFILQGSGAGEVTPMQ